MHIKSTLMKAAGLLTILSLTVISGGCGTATVKLASGTDSKLIENSSDGEHAITADGEDDSYIGTKVRKTGKSEGDEADFYGENSAIFATNGARLTLKDMDIETDGTHANAVFSYGEETTVSISDSVINTKGSCSGGLMTTGGGTMNAENLEINTKGNSSAAIRSDRGGGTVNVTGGTYTTSGKGSPVIYSTADITVNSSTLTSNASQGVVVEGKNSVTLNDVDLTALNNTKNSDKSDCYQAVMIYQSMSGDADEGVASFTMNGSTLTNKNGDIFFVNNTKAEISLKSSDIINEDESGVFLRAAAAGWGNAGSNGGHVDMTAEEQTINGDMLIDDISSLNLSLKDTSSFNGAINPEGKEGDIYVELSGDSKWTLTADSYISSLTCETGSIDLNGHKLYVNGEEYKEGSSSTGEAIEVESTTTGRPEGAPPDGQGGPGGNPPKGNPPEGTEKPESTPPDGVKKPDGSRSAGMPPEKKENG
ncbi:MAG: hypothetical protein K5668_02250 [Lachnospiraceae bacterium]|nr:hypothetical protein [Lachnospiraceae bacterium]